jgi:hypothetical protein
MKKRLILSLLLAVSLIFACGCEINLVKLPEYYELNDGDSVISFTNVVGERDLNTKKLELNNAVQRIAYSFKNVEDAYADAEKYIDHLMEEEGFYYAGMLNMDETEDEITIYKTSPNDSEFEIRVIVRYNVNTKSVKVTIEREKVIE